MQTIQFIVLSVFLSIVISSTGCASENNPEMDHPLLGLSFDPAKVIYDTPPLDVVKIGYDSYKSPERFKYWLFASYKDEANTGNEYYIASGLVASQLDTPVPQEGELEPHLGVVVLKAQGKYIVKGAAIEFEMLGFSEKVVKGLAVDAANRAIRAYGNVDNLQTALDLQWEKGAALNKSLVEALSKAGIKNIKVQDFGH